MATKKKEEITDETYEVIDAPEVVESVDTIPAKPVSEEEILEKMDSAIELLAKLESDRRTNKRPYRFPFMVRKQLELIRQNFKKSLK
jgi:hypothetical protein